MVKSPKPNRRHGFYLLVMVIGWVLPPIAVLLRFGFGTDFFLNILLTLAGYIPGHGHNFYLQNIRNNENRKRTPRWASRAGLVKDPGVKRKAKTQWANRYDERTPTRADGYQDEEVAPVAAAGRRDWMEPELTSASSASSGSTDHQPEREPASRTHAPLTRRSSFSDELAYRPDSLHTITHRSSFSSSVSKKPIRRTFSQKLGFGKKAEKKNRFDRTNEARAQWNFNESSAFDDRFHSYPTAAAGGGRGGGRRAVTIAGDGLDHTF